MGSVFLLLKHDVFSFPLFCFPKEIVFNFFFNCCSCGNDPHKLLICSIRTSKKKKKKVQEHYLDSKLKDKRKGHSLNEVSQSGYRDLASTVKMPEVTREAEWVTCFSQQRFSASLVGWDVWEALASKGRWSRPVLRLALSSFLGQGGPCRGQPPRSTCPAGQRAPAAGSVAPSAHLPKCSALREPWG